MPQSSYAYAVARIRAKENGLIGRDKMSRLAESSLEEAVRMLVESGYGNMPEATAADCEAMIAHERDDAARLVQEITPEPEITDLFLLKTDIHNLKVLLKARLLDSQDVELVSGGVYLKEKLTLAVRDHDYRDLPGALRDALEALEKELPTREDPQRVSVRLDQAYHTHAGMILNKHKNAFASDYFKALADFDNVLALLRLRAMGASKEELADVVLPGGSIPKSTLVDAMEQPQENMVKQVSTGVAGSAIQKGLEEMLRTDRVSALEKARDNHLMELTKKGKYDVMTLQPVLGYLLAREQEARCIRLIVTVKRNGLDEGVITERLRELYG